MFGLTRRKAAGGTARWLRTPGAVAVAVAGALVVWSAPAMAAQAGPYTCAGGDFPTGTPESIASGTYASITITGWCDVVPNAKINILGNLDVTAGAFFDAQSAPSTITVGNDVTAASGSLLGLGCQPNFLDNKGNPVKTGHPCGDPYGAASSTITVKGDLTANDADTVLLNGITVNGDVTLTGGGGVIPWSIKNNTIKRNLTVSGVTADWFGALFNWIGRDATLTDITANDPEDIANNVLPTVYVVRNTVGRDLTCFNLGPALSGGFIPGEVNTVRGDAIGQCAALV